MKLSPKHLKRYKEIAQLFWKYGFQHELNYEREAQNLVTVGENLKEFELIQVPQPVPDYSTRCVLTMDYVKGRKITSIGPLARLEMEGAPLTEALFKAYLKQVLVDGGFPKDCQSHHDGHCPGRADHGSVPVDAGRDTLSPLWLSRSGHSLLFSRSDRRILVGHQHFCSRPQKSEESSL